MGCGLHFSQATLMPWGFALVKGREKPRPDRHLRTVVTDSLIFGEIFHLSLQPGRNRFRHRMLRFFEGRAGRSGTLWGLQIFGVKNHWMRMERRLGAMSPAGSTIVLSVMAVVMASLVHLVLYFDGAKLTPLAFSNITVETLAVAVPLILYSRLVITQLEKSRNQLSAMSRRLAFAVDEAELANRAKSSFLANMSHELRTPLNAILGFSEVMKDQHLGPVQNSRYLSYANDIHSSGRHLLAIINDVLDLAKIEAGKMTLDNATLFEISPLLSSSLAMLKGLGEKYGVTVHNEIAEDGLQLKAVERMIRQILINLVGNAIKFTPAGGSVYVTGRLLGDGCYEVAVRDTGVGMTEKEMAHAMMPFGQNENRFTGKHEGTGLGLPLAKAMLELHEGALTMSSVPEVGTTVTMTFPAYRVIGKGRAAA
jgi:signal transduction histidine kinase